MTGSVMSTDQARPDLPRERIAIARPGWRRLLLAVIAIDSLLAVGAWFAVGYIHEWISPTV